ncbi:MAG TPA: uroporphyrinogen-III synthase [Burkholderiales bacterium]|nr:uroporphyrinogen-III synthase [Burkholderiales bacterium]
MNNKRIAVLESRFGEHLVDLLAKQGAIPLHAPALAEQPDLDAEAIRRLIEEWRARPFKLAIFQTGVGSRALFEAAEKLGLAPNLLALLAQSIVAVRGPKPTAVLRGRNIRIDISAEEPYTTVEVLAAIRGVELSGARVLVQRYGETNLGLEEGLEARGATVIEVPTYRWALPEDIGPLLRLLDALARGEIDAAVFTSASQVRNLFTVAEQRAGADQLRRNLNSVLVASIGPVCSDALAAAGVHVTLEASPPKLGPLVAMLDKGWK